MFCGSFSPGLVENFEGLEKLFWHCALQDDARESMLQAVGCQKQPGRSLA